jgi:hypothetical protein
MMRSMSMRSQSSSTKWEWVKRKRDWGAIRASPVHAPEPATDPAALTNGFKVPCGHDQNIPQCLDADCSDRSARSDVFLREEPDEEEDDEEDEGNSQEDDDDDDEGDDGYSE